jgi:hypothetical protein
VNPAVTAIAVLTSTLLLGGCGGPPDDASKKDFCAQLKQINSEKSWKDTQSAVRRLEDVGTPRGISKDARAGFEDLVGYTADAKDREALVTRIDKLGKADRKQLDAFDSYLTKTCRSS